MIHPLAGSAILSERSIGATFAAVETMTLEEMINLSGREVVAARTRQAVIATYWTGTVP